ncbi:MULTISPECIES: helix-hairpin-helix domain-containing protein [unclassified Streptococcus]|uniref:helix-hairpin-helix domain-containing protein n=1 Tax=unclassified Streptococcus TaxID=2608887 RepID=UPI0018AB314B|nr:MULTISPECIES: helix-hairpin-helix domain-containing protein [unclassified Streptococcus]MBF8970413.1 helix-hairpin-helix domain-containing protein [Streptococcus sp. NLN76]MBJ6745013.1 helix-hairpin-helix domain-containing protein [Streptococcus sp. 121]
MAKKKNSKKKLKELRRDHLRNGQSKIINFESWLQDDVEEQPQVDIEHLKERIQNLFENKNFSFDNGLTKEERAYYDARALENPIERLRAFRKLRKKYPDNLAIQSYLFSARRDEYCYDDFVEAQEIQRKAKDAWAKEGYASWVWFESREPLKALYSVLIYYLEMDFLTQAAGLVDFILEMHTEEFPDMFVYPMLSVYNMLYRHEDIVNFYEYQKALGWEDDGVLVHLIISHLLHGDHKAAASVFEELALLNPIAIHVLGQVYWNVGLHSDNDFEYYRPNSAEYLRFSLSFMSRFLIDKRKMAFELNNIVENFIENQPDSPTKRNEFFNSPAMKGIHLRQGHAICDAGIMSLEALEQHTESEIRAIPGIGKKTINQLKANGVNFRNHL